MKKINSLAVVLCGLLFLAAPVFAEEASTEGKIKGPIRAEIKQEIKDATPGAARQAIKDKFARISGATVTSITNNSLTITTDARTVTVNILATTKLLRKFWGRATISEFSVGDVINVLGVWTDDTHATVNATLLRNRSIQKRNGVFVGKVTSVSSTGWVLETFNRGPQTVTVSTTTKFVDRTGRVAAQTDVVTGNMVRVRGMWDSKNSTITEVTTVKDYSLPVKPAEKTATPSATQ